ncbi:MAG: carbohydrate kinase family protein [Spirochaetales bacterium]|jgi:sugar/nucleoside kinase (ribokinase family)|nr:carbohydrate kinase family protein [Spirochaetales bacterium]
MGTGDVDVICAGLNVVNFPIFPVDETLFTRDINPVEPVILLPGGDAANQAVVLSKLGFKTALCSRRGDDDFGKIMLDLLKSYGNGINLDGIVVDPEKATSISAMMIRANGQRHFCVHKGAMFNFCFDDIDTGLISRAKVVSIGGVFALPSFDGAGAAAFFRKAREQGVITVADTKYDTYKIGLDGIRPMLKYTDYFFPSYDEATAISGETEPEKIAKVFLNAGAVHTGIKLGPKGIYFLDSEREFYMPALPADVVDTTGAGDNFMSGFIAGLVRGWDIHQCCLFGSAAAALCVTKVGPMTAVESFEQVERFLKTASADI